MYITIPPVISCCIWLFPTGGETQEEKARVDMILAETTDLNSGFVRICYNPEFVSLSLCSGLETTLDVHRFELYVFWT